MVARIARRAVLGAALALLSVLPAPARTPPRLEPLQVVTSRGIVDLKVEVVDTDATRERGLMYRRSLPADQGMLFDFVRERPEVAFWMKNTFIPLDIIYIRSNGRVLSIARNARPFDETPLPSGGPTLGVLEIGGGRAAELGIKPGDLVKHRIFRRD